MEKETASSTNGAGSIVGQHVEEYKLIQSHSYLLGSTLPPGAREIGVEAGSRKGAAT